MADLFAKAADFLCRSLRSGGARLVQYERDSARCQLRATPGRSTWEISDGVALVRDESQDFVFSADDLVIPGVGKTEPQAGDKVYDQQDSTTYVYEVMPFGSQVGQRGTSWRYADSYHTRVRVHTREVDRET